MRKTNSAFYTNHSDSQSSYSSCLKLFLLEFTNSNTTEESFWKYFTALRGLAMRILFVNPSVCPSVCQTRALWQKGRKISPDFYTIRKIIYLSFLRKKELLVGSDPFYLKFWVNRPPLERNRRFWIEYFLYVFCGLFGKKRTNESFTRREFFSVVRMSIK